MANNEVNVTMTAATANAQQAWLSMIGLAERMEQTLRRIGRTGARSAQQTSKEMSLTRQAIGSVGQAALQFAGVGGPLALMYTTAQAIRAEFQQIRDLAKGAGDFQLRRAQAFSGATMALGVGRVTAGGEQFTGRELDQLVQRLGAETGVSQVAALDALAGAFASGPQISPELVATIPFRAGQAFRHMIRPDDSQQLAAVSTSLLEIMKSQELKGAPISVEQAIAAFANTYRLSRATTLEEFSGPFMSYISLATAKRPGVEDFEDLSAVIAALQQAAVDPSGRRSATNLSLSFEDAFRIAAESSPELRHLSSEDLRMRIRDATPDQRQLWMARQRILGSYAPELSDRDVRALGFQQGELGGEERTKGLIRAMFIKGSALDRMIEENKKATRNILSQQRAQETFAEFAELQSLEAMHPLEMEATRIASSEASAMGMTPRAQSDRILAMVIEAINNTEAKPLRLPTGPPLEQAAAMQFAFSGKDPESIVRGSINRLDRAVGTLVERQQSEADNPVRVRDLQRQIDALEITRFRLVSELEYLARDRTTLQTQAPGTSRERGEKAVELTTALAQPGVSAAVQTDLGETFNATSGDIEVVLQKNADRIAALERDRQENRKTLDAVNRRAARPVIGWMSKLDQWLFQREEDRLAAEIESRKKAQSAIVEQIPEEQRRSLNLPEGDGARRNEAVVQAMLRRHFQPADQDMMSSMLDVDERRPLLEQLREQEQLAEQLAREGEAQLQAETARPPDHRNMRKLEEHRRRLEILERQVREERIFAARVKELRQHIEALNEQARRDEQKAAEIAAYRVSSTALPPAQQRLRTFVIEEPIGEEARATRQSEVDSMLGGSTSPIATMAQQYPEETARFLIRERAQPVEETFREVADFVSTHGGDPRRVEQIISEGTKPAIQLQDLVREFPTQVAQYAAGDQSAPVAAPTAGPPKSATAAEIDRLLSPNERASLRTSGLIEVDSEDPVAAVQAGLTATAQREAELDAEHASGQVQPRFAERREQNARMRELLQRMQRRQQEEAAKPAPERAGVPAPDQPWLEDPKNTPEATPKNTPEATPKNTPATLWENFLEISSRNTPDILPKPVLDPFFNKIPALLQPETPVTTKPWLEDPTAAVNSLLDITRIRGNDAIQGPVVTGLYDDFVAAGVRSWSPEAADVGVRSLRETRDELRQQNVNAAALASLEAAIDRLIAAMQTNGSKPTPVNVVVRESLNAPAGAPVK